MLVLLMLVAGPLLLLALFLYTGGLYNPLQPSYIDPSPHADRFPERVGIEFLFFPLGVLAAVLMRQRLTAIRALHTSKVGDVMPLLSAGTLVLWIAFLWWAWSEDGAWWIGSERLVGVGLTASLGFLGAILYPRLTATVAEVVGIAFPMHPLKSGRDRTGASCRPPSP